jgi:aminomethyltransferase
MTEEAPLVDYSAFTVLIYQPKNEVKMAELKRTPLYDLHVALGAKMVPFAGYEMPVQYQLGVMKEHIQTRKLAGLFDVSHMGQVIIRPKSGNISDAALALEKLIPIDIVGLKENRQRYGFFTNDNGGILDDLMVANQGDHLFMVVNAGCKENDINHLLKNLKNDCIIETVTDRALIALQGPSAEAVLSTFSPDVVGMRFMDTIVANILGASVWISRSGYTGEDGYEMSVPNESVVELTNALIAFDSVELIGLGARDSLRLEAGLCLYGHDIDTTTTPSESALTWAIQKVRRYGGERAGKFNGADCILNEIEQGADRKRVGLRPAGRAPMREGIKIFLTETAETSIGVITSGGFGPTVQHAISMGYINTEFSEVGTTVFAEIRGKRMEATIIALPFTPPNFKR